MSDERKECCCYCGLVIRGKVEFRIHRDGMGEGPELPLCKTCGEGTEPSCEEIWRSLAREQQLKQREYWRER